jgi:RNA polymerase sigma-70 factor (ECF subfamily)
MARDVLGKLLVQLSYPYREVLTLRYLEEMDVLEIAKALDLGESAAKMRLKRAREQLEQLCQASGLSADALR